MLRCVRMLALWLLAALLAAAGAMAATRRTPTLSPTNVVIDGPSPDIQSLNGLSIARDGGGGLVYVKNVGGVAHIFVSRLLGGSFQPPQQVDAGLSTASTQPVIAAGQGGVLVVAFVNAGTLYVAQAPNALSPIGAPSPLVDGAINPAISMSTFGKAYLAFTVVGVDDQVRTAFYHQGQWSVAPDPLNADPRVDAGGGAQRPAVICSGDGVGIVAWGEGGHIYTRRVVGTSPSAAILQADPPTVGGWPVVATSDPTVSSGGDSSYASVTFQAELANGAVRQSRVLMNHLHAGQYDGIFEADGLQTSGGEGADQPQTAVTEFGAGWVTSEHDGSHQLFATVLGTNAGAQSVGRIDSSDNTSPPDAVPATAGVTSTLIAWQQTPGISGPAEIRVRYAPDGSDLGPEQVVSSPAFGATDADSGLAAGGDVSGDAAIAWIQGTGADTRLVTGQLYQSPGNFVPALTFRYATSVNPILAWSASAELWGAPRYAVEFDGVPIDQTYATAIRTPAPVANGRHSWAVTATNQAGLTTSARLATVFVDTAPPRAIVRLSGRRTVRMRQTIAVTRTDPPPPGAAPSAASGLASTVVRWGDGTRVQIGRTARHAFKRARTYTITVTVTDRAGNRTVLTRKLTIKPKPKPKPKKRRKPKRTKKKRKAAHRATAGSRR
jgi:PKD domain